MVIFIYIFPQKGMWQSLWFNVVFKKECLVLFIFQLQLYVGSTYVLLAMMLLKRVYELGCCFALFSKDYRP